MLTTVVLFVVSATLNIQHTDCKVSWSISTFPAIFGQNIELTCHTSYILRNSKDCPVREWSGGPNRRGLLYNGFSSNITKYEERANLSSNQFSMIIKNLSETDVNVNYTCSCGFETFTNKLKLNDKEFKAKPERVVFSIKTNNRVVNVRMTMDRVYPLPACSFLIGDRMVSKKMSLEWNKQAIFYSVTLNTTNILQETDCKKQPVIRCEFGTNLKTEVFEGHEIENCTDDMSGTTEENITVDPNKKQVRSSTAVWFAVGLSVAVIAVMIAAVYRLIRRLETHFLDCSYRAVTLEKRDII